MEWWQNRGLNFKAATGIAITMMVVLGVIFVLLSQYFRNVLWQSEIQKTKDINSIAHILLDDAMMAGRKDSIQTALNQLGTEIGNQQLNSIAVYDDKSNLTSFASGFPGSIKISKESMPENVEEPSCWECHKFPAEDRPSYLTVEVEGRDMIRYSVPLYNEDRCQTCHGTGKQVLGDIMVDFSQDQFNRSYATLLIGLGGGLVLAINLVAFVLYQVIRRIVLIPLSELVDDSEAISKGNLDRRIEIKSKDEIGILAQAFASMVSQLKEVIDTLESRVRERTKEIQTSAEVSRRLSNILDQKRLLLSVVEEIKRAFNFYHVQIYLLDETEQNLIMVGGTGEAGQIMLERGHKIPTGTGLVGRAAANKEVVLVPDTTNDDQWLPNTLLPDTKSEVAVPILIENKVLGVLDVQHQIPNGLTDSIADMLQSVANQVAIAMQNANLFAQAQEQAEREAIISSIGQKIQTATTVEGVLEIAAKELSTKLSLKRALVQLDSQAMRSSIKNR